MKLEHLLYTKCWRIHGTGKTTGLTGIEVSGQFNSIVCERTSACDLFYEVSSVIAVYFAINILINSHLRDTGPPLCQVTYRIHGDWKRVFIQFKCTRYSRDNLTLSMRIVIQCFNYGSELSSGYYKTKTSQLTYTAEVN